MDNAEVQFTIENLRSRIKNLEMECEVHRETAKKLEDDNRKLKSTLLEIKELVYKHVFIQNIIEKTLEIVR
jgi:predicted nuclease with TOPRIM domain